MRKKLLIQFLMVMMSVVGVVFGFISCGGNKNSPNSSHTTLDSTDTTLYTLSLTTQTYEVEMGEIFIVPIPQVSPALPNGKEIEWLVKYAKENVEKSTDGKGFVADKEGVYTITYKVDGLNAEPLFVTVNSVKILRDTSAPTNVAVDEKGIITFQAEENREYSLYIDDVAVGVIQRGDNISSLVNEGETRVAVRIDASSDAKESPLSDTVNVKKCEATTITFTDNILTFEEKPDFQYHLWISGINKGLITSGTNISQYLGEGTNDIYVITSKDGWLDSKLSNYLTRISHLKITDFSVLSNGQVSFTSRQGFIYKLYLNGEEKGEVSSLDNVSWLFASLSEGEHIFNLKIIPVAEHCSVSDVNATSNEAVLEKLISPEFIMVENDELYFNTVEGARVNLYVDGQEKGLIENGGSLVNFYKFSPTIKVAFSAEKDGYITSTVSEETEIEVPEIYRLIDGEVLNQAEYEYSNGVKVNGARVTVTEGETVKIAKAFPFDGAVLAFSYCNLGGEYDITHSVVRFTDVTTGKKLELSFALNAMARSANAVYVGWKYDGEEWAFNDPIDDSKLSVNLSDNMAGGNSRYIVIYYTQADGLYFNAMFSTEEAGNTTAFPTELDLVGFGKNGVYAEIQTQTIENNTKTADFMILAHGAKPAYNVELNTKVAFDCGKKLKGETYTVTMKDDIPVKVKENVMLEGDFLTLGFIISDPTETEAKNYQWRYAWITLTDRTTLEKFVIGIHLPNKSFTWNNTGIGWEYGGNSQPCLQSICIFDVSTTTITIGYDAKKGITFNGKKFNEILATPAYKEEFGRDPGLLTGFGVNGVDISIKLDGIGSYIVGVEEIYTVENNVSYTYKNGTGQTITGMEYMINQLNVPVKVSDNVAFTGTILKFGFKFNTIGQLDWEKAEIRFIDKKDSTKVLTLKFYTNVNIAYGQGYVGVSYGTTTIVKDGTGGKIIEMKDMETAGIPVTISYESGTLKVASTSSLTHNISLAEYIDSNFGANGVDVAVVFTNGEYSTGFDSASIIVDEPYTVEKNQTYTYKNGESVTGAKYTVDSLNTWVRVANGVAFQNEF